MRHAEAADERATLIRVKHLITLDRELNGEVLHAMEENLVVPILPRPVLSSCPDVLGGRMLTVASFVALAKERQAKLTADGRLAAL